MCLFNNSKKINFIALSLITMGCCENLKAIKNQPKSGEVVTISIPSPRSMFDEMERFFRDFEQDTTVSWGRNKAPRSQTQYGNYGMQLRSDVEALERKMQEDLGAVRSIMSEMNRGICSTQSAKEFTEKMKDSHKKNEFLLHKVELSLHEVEKVDGFKVIEELADSKYIATISLPGYAKEDVNARVEGGLSEKTSSSGVMQKTEKTKTLTVVATKQIETIKKETEEKDGVKISRASSSHHSWRRNVMLGDSRTASFEYVDGKLTVKIMLPENVEVSNEDEVDMEFKNNALIVTLPIEEKKANVVKELKFTK